MPGVAEAPKCKFLNAITINSRRTRLWRASAILQVPSLFEIQNPGVDMLLDDCAALETPTMPALSTMTLNLPRMLQKVKAPRLFLNDSLLA